MMELSPESQRLLKAWLLTLMVIPMLWVLSWKLVYVVYVCLLLAAITSRGRLRISKACTPLILASLWLLVVALAHVDQLGSLVNIAAIVLANVVIIVSVPAIIRELHDVNSVLMTIGRFCVASTGVWLIASVLFSRFAEVTNPIEDLIAGNRLRLLSSPVDGHSVLIDVSFVGMAIALFCADTKRYRFGVSSFFAMCLVLSKSAVAWALVGVCVSVLAIEALKLRVAARSVVYASLVVAIALSGPVKDRALEFVRGTLQRVDVDVYKGDLTAGRAELNRLLLDEIERAPYFGAGHDSDALRYGLRDDESGRGAMSESGLRLPAKYGVPYALFLCLLPFSVFVRGVVSKSAKIRCPAVALSLGVLAMLSANSTLETPHAFSYFFLLGVLLLLSVSITLDRKQPRVSQAAR